MLCIEGSAKCGNLAPHFGHSGVRSALRKADIAKRKHCAQTAGYSIARALQLTGRNWCPTVQFFLLAHSKLPS